MKILMITSYLPYPLFGGGEVRTYNLLKRLCKKHEITLVAYTRPSNTQNDINEVKKICKELIILEKPKTWTLKNILRTGLSTMPLLLTVYHSKKDRNKIKQAISNNHFDVIHVEPFYIMHNLPSTNIPILLVEHNIEYEVYKRYVKHFPFIPLRPLLSLDVKKMKEWEEVMWHRAKKVAVVSKIDQEKIEANGVKNVEIIPNGVDLIDFPYKTELNVKTNPVILYVGNMRWFENRDAANYLLTNLWPEIKKNIPNSKIRIIGRDANIHFKNNPRDSIFVESNVKDIYKEYANASCLLAPIRKGGGTKYKIIEAMAVGLPVVTTTIGKEGLDIIQNIDVKIGDTDKDLVSSVMEIVNNDEERNRIRENARKLVEKLYSWESISEKLDNLYRTFKTI